MGWIVRARINMPSRFVRWLIPIADWRSNSSTSTFHPLSRAASRRSNNAAPASSGPPVPNSVQGHFEPDGRTPDVILMDLEMPDTDRWEPVRRLKNDPQTRDIPIIGMSAHALESERVAIATGCDEFDAKPIEFDSLVATIRRVLAHPK
jgi:CheY-like chemotaxis protein